MTPFGENIWLLTFPLKKLGVDMRRNTTVIRLTSGELVIHSTAPFTAADIAAIAELGKPGWIAEAMMHHDTFAKEGHEAFPGAVYLAPPGFDKLVDFSIQQLLPAPPAWSDELEVLAIDGIPSLEEYVFFHRSSRTLITADLVFNFGYDEGAWAEFLLKVAVGSEHHPGMSRPFKGAIKDETAFKESVAKMLAWDFDRVIVGHGDPITSGGKEKVTTMLRHAGY